MPLTRLDTEFDAEQVTNDADESLRRSGLGSANLHSVVTNTFAELALNAYSTQDRPWEPTVSYSSITPQGGVDLFVASPMAVSE